MNNATEAELVRRAKGGDTEAFGELVRSHQSLAFRVAYLVTRSESDAEEAAQDGCVRAWKAIGRFHDGAPFAPWLLHIVRNQARNRVRSRVRRSRMLDRLQAEPTHPAPGADNPALTSIDQQDLLDAVDALSRPLREVISCLYLLELSEVETATVLGLARGTVKSRAARARALLSREIER